VLEKLAHGERRALLSLATGAGKTYIAVQLLRKIAAAGQLHRALFVCDRDELRNQALTAFQNEFGADAAAVSSGNPQKNARILIATYQTLDVDTDEAAASFLVANYPENYFSHIVIDECHRSAWGKWSQVLMRNPDAVQIGLTATPRQLEVSERSREAEADRQVNADNLRHFGEPVYEYDMGQGIEDGYLAACEIVRRDIFLDDNPRNERETGVEQEDLKSKTLRDANTGEPVGWVAARARYDATAFEDRLLLPERVSAMARDLFDYLLATGGPEQKTIIFCARDRHADDVAAALNNLYAAWCAAEGRSRLEPYAFKCTAASGGQEYLADLRGASRHHFIATTVDLLTTGVDVPCIRNVVFFKYVRSPIAFHQMVGRGTRLDATTGKLMFRVYDYTDATRLFGQGFVTRSATVRVVRPGETPPPPPERTLQVEGFDVRVTDAGQYIVTSVDGQAQLVTVEEYRERLAGGSSRRRRLSSSSGPAGSCRPIGGRCWADCPTPAGRCCWCVPSPRWPISTSTTSWPSSAMASPHARARAGPRHSGTSTETGSRRFRPRPRPRCKPSPRSSPVREPMDWRAQRCSGSPRSCVPAASLRSRASASRRTSCARPRRGSSPHETISTREWVGVGASRANGCSTSIAQPTSKRSPSQPAHAVRA
jgi:type I restriction enzyme R subunit